MTMAKTYTCPHADIEWEGIICKKDGQPCGNIRWCMEKGRVILTEQALTCTRRKEGDRNDGTEAHKDNSDTIPNEI